MRNLDITKCLWCLSLVMSRRLISEETRKAYAQAPSLPFQSLATRVLAHLRSLSILQDHDFSE